MKAPDLYDEKKLARQLQMQRRLTWDLETRLDWSLGVDLTKPLLPLDHDNILFPEADPEQRLVISQLMGLIVASTIAQLEQIANDLKGPTWERVLNKYPVNPEFYELGLQFYREEAKHAVAFNRYIEMFSTALGVEPDDLKRFLPEANKAFYKKAYALNSVAGGMSLWWLVTAVEEESVVIFRYMERFKERIDPLYFQLHRAHFEEELRHKSYALMMLQLFEEFSGVKRSLLFKKLDFFMAECLNLTWTLGELFKIKGLRKFKNHHPFFKTLDGLMDTLGKRSGLGILHTLLTSAPYISDTLRLSDHDHVRVMLQRFGALQAPLPHRRQQRSVCIA